MTTGARTGLAGIGMVLVSALLGACATDEPGGRVAGAAANGQAPVGDSPASTGAPGSTAQTPASAVDGSASAAGGAAAPTVVDFLPFGPVPETTEEELAAWTALVRERFLEDPVPERAAALDAELAALDIVDATPAFLNAVRGLDMADGEDVVQCAALVEHWYVAQARFQQIHVNGDGDKTELRHAGSRLAAIDGWVRWWQRKTTTEGSLERYRRQVEGLLAELERLRAERRALQ